MIRMRMMMMRIWSWTSEGGSECVAVNMPIIFVVVLNAAEDVVW